MDAKQVGALFELAVSMPKDSGIAQSLDTLATALRADFHAGGKVGHCVAALFRALADSHDSAYAKLGAVERMAVTMLAGQGTRWLERKAKT